MKSLILASVFALASTAAIADGLETASADIGSAATTSAWDGMYFGGSAFALNGSEAVEVDTKNARIAPLSFATDVDDKGLGAFAGYRQGMGSFVLGGEVGAMFPQDGDTLLTAEGQVGLNAGALLPYVSAGYGKAGGENGEVFGVGADLNVTDSPFVGAKFQKVNIGEGSNVISLRAGFNF